MWLRARHCAQPPVRAARRDAKTAGRQHTCWLASAPTLTSHTFRYATTHTHTHTVWLILALVQQQLNQQLQAPGGLAGAPQVVQQQLQLLQQRHQFADGMGAARGAGRPAALGEPDDDDEPDDQLGQLDQSEEEQQEEEQEEEEQADELADEQEERRPGARDELCRRQAQLVNRKRACEHQVAGSGRHESGGARYEARCESGSEEPAEVGARSSSGSSLCSDERRRAHRRAQSSSGSSAGSSCSDSEGALGEPEPARRAPGAARRRQVEGAEEEAAPDESGARQASRSKRCRLDIGERRAVGAAQSLPTQRAAGGELSTDSGQDDEHEPAGGQH